LKKRARGGNHSKKRKKVVPGQPSYETGRIKVERPSERRPGVRWRAGGGCVGGSHETKICHMEKKGEKRWSPATADALILGSREKKNEIAQRRFASSREMGV